MRQTTAGILSACLAFGGCGLQPLTPSPTPVAPVVTYAIEGTFTTAPWQHSRRFTVAADGVLSARISFLGDYNYWLWIEVWEGDTLLGQRVARGWPSPKQKLEVDVRQGRTYEVRLWTDRPGSRYQGFIDTPD